MYILINVKHVSCCEEVKLTHIFHLYPVNVGLHLQLLHQLPGLCDAGRVIARHGRCQSGLVCSVYIEEKEI